MRKILAFLICLGFVLGEGNLSKLNEAGLNGKQATTQPPLSDTLSPVSPSGKHTMQTEQNLKQEANGQILKLNATPSESNPNQTAIELSFSGLFLNADAIVKSVIILLSVFSVISWAIFIFKFMQFRGLNTDLNADLAMLRSVLNIDELSNLNGVSTRLYAELKDELEKSLESEQGIAANRIQVRMAICTEQLISKSKNGASILASIGSSSPFIGLFGTIWGVMHSFVGIANESNTSLSVVAPGIAEALFATAFGLVAAIPAVLFYNYLVRQAVKFALRLDEVSGFLYILVDRKSIK
ncbi:MAG: MotA/TolQ/ExbB proton channel family protein [Campylobacter sp.]|nr:MotA/TolQ/ExbB proton channel family protein [Campylobacter sp.]